MTDALEVRGGTIEEALANGRALLADHPDAALTQAQTLLKLGPDGRVLRLAAAAHRRLGDTERAEQAELAAIELGLTMPQLRAAAQAEHDGRSAEASALAAKQLWREPDDLLAATISAEAAISLRRLDEGERLLRGVLERTPSFLRASMFLARGLMLQSRTAEAVDVMRAAVERVPLNLPATTYLAQLQAEALDFDGAAATYEGLLHAHDRDPALWVSYGDMLRFLGRATDSAIAYRRAILSDPGNGSAWWALSNLDPDAISNEDIARMSSAIDERADRPEDKGALHFALGAALEKREQYGDAFAHFAAGNSMREHAQPYDPSILSDEVDRSCAFFTADRFEPGSRLDAADDGPIFIIGMPRSGSTLVERILGRHSEIEALGELPIIPRQVDVLSTQGGGIGRFREQIAAGNRDRIAELGSLYLERATGFRKTGKHYFTDKLHMNWRHAGYIHLILPKAKIIDVRRAPLDCCWSNYKLLFTRGHPAASSLSHIGQFYRDYVRMMNHLDTVAPGAVLRLHYEDLVNAPEQEARRMLDFLGLRFEEDCLSFHQSTEAVATASSEQVRRPLNRDGIGGWRPYARHLAPLREALGPLAAERA